MTTAAARSVGRGAAQYVHARVSSNLSSSPSPSSPIQAIDAIIAAGLLRESLGGLLVRLMLEWDGIDKRKLREFNDGKACPWLSSTELTIIGLRVPSFLPARTALRDYTSATVRRYYGKKLPPPDLPQARIADSVLLYHLEPACPDCHGRGSKLLALTTRLGNPCPACQGTGKRPLYNQDLESADIGRAVLKETERKMRQFDGLLRKHLPRAHAACLGVEQARDMLPATG